MPEDRMTEDTKKHEDEPQKEAKPEPQSEPDDLFGFMPGDFTPGGQI